MSRDSGDIIIIIIIIIQLLVLTAVEFSLGVSILTLVHTKQIRMNMHI